MEENTPPVPEPEKPKTETPTVTPVTKPADATPKKKANYKWVWWLVGIVIVILVPVIIYFVKQMEIDRLKDAQKKEIGNVRLQAADLVKKNNETNLQNVAKVFTWAVRAEAMRQNMDQINQMMIELVKIDEYRQVVLLADDGTVVLSTDKKYEGEGFSESFYKQILGANEVKIYPQKNGDLFVSAPVFGIDVRLGTVVIAYRPAALEFPDVPAEPGK
jgi:hypothetical protein